MNTPRPRPVPGRRVPDSAEPAGEASASQRFLAARERAIQILSDRFADDALSEAEFEGRLDRLFAATDPVAVDAVVADLLPPAPLARSRGGTMPAAAPEESRILVVMGETRRTGRWTVPRLLRVRSVMGNVKIDLRDARIPEGFTLDVGAYMAGVTIIVPPGVPVAFDVFAMMGNAINQAHERGEPAATAPRVRVHGTVFMGELKVLVRERRA